MKWKASSSPLQQPRNVWSETNGRLTNIYLCPDKYTPEKSAHLPIGLIPIFKKSNLKHENKGV